MEENNNNNNNIKKWRKERRQNDEIYNKYDKIKISKEYISLIE